MGGRRIPAGFFILRLHWDRSPTALSGSSMGEIITAPPSGSLATLLSLQATPAKQAPKSRKGFAIQASPATLHTFLEIWAMLAGALAWR